MLRARAKFESELMQGRFASVARSIKWSHGVTLRVATWSRVVCDT
jgi:hypothetical protein